MTRLADLCGTWRGVKAHRRLGEPCCDQCAVVKAARAREYRRVRAIRAAADLVAWRTELADLPTPGARLAASVIEGA